MQADIEARHKSSRTSAATSSQWGLRRATLWAIIGVCALIDTLFGVLLITYKASLHWRSTSPTKIQPRPRSFYDAYGSTGYSYDVVPDIIHLVRYNQAELTFEDAVFLRSMYINHRPSEIMVHCSPCGFIGPYTRFIEGIPLTYVPTVFPTGVFGTPFNPEWPQHSTDIVRIRVLLRYGGIYLDSDVFVVQSLRRFLRYEATVAWFNGGFFGNMIMIAHKNSRLIRLFMDTYHEFNASLWDYNSAEVPTTQLAEKRPHLFRRVYYGLETHMGPAIYLPHCAPDWRYMYATHTLVNHRGYDVGDPLFGVWLNETNIRDYDTAMGQMARSVLFGTSDFVPPGAPVLNVTELAARTDRGEDLTRMGNGSSRPFY